MHVSIVDYLEFDKYTYIQVTLYILRKLHFGLYMCVYVCIHIHYTYTYIYIYIQLKFFKKAMNL